MEARGLENFERGTARIGMKVIVERIRPQDNFALVLCSGGRSPGVFPEAGNSIFSSPVLECGAGELRHAPLRGQVQRALQEVAETRRLAGRRLREIRAQRRMT